MNIIGYMNKLNSIGKYLLILVLAVNLVSLSYASTANIGAAMSSLCGTAKAFLGATAMILVVLAGATYAIGQILGAETRARAAVWATAMLTGAVIGLVIYLIMPPLIGLLFTGQAGGDPCASLTIS
ncbi:MAG: hypothetical protein V1827_02315 [Candidatus Micrarchaeota archaeon]